MQPSQGVVVAADLQRRSCASHTSWELAQSAQSWPPPPQASSAVPAVQSEPWQHPVSQRVHAVGGGVSDTQVPSWQRVPPVQS